MLPGFTSLGVAAGGRALFDCASIRVAQWSSNRRKWSATNSGVAWSYFVGGVQFNTGVN